MGKGKDTFRTHLRQVVERDLGKSLDTLDDIRRSHWMTKVYVTDILRPLYPGSIPEDAEDLQGSFVDGSRDAQADFICRNDNIVTIIQAKYRGADKAEDPGQLDSFCDILNRLHPTAGSKVPKNAALREIVADIDWNNDRFDLHFITLGRVNEAMRDREQRGITHCKEIPGIQDRAEISLLDERDLNDRLRDALSALEGIREPVEIRFDRDKGQPPWVLHNADGRRAFVGVVQAKHLGELKRFRNRVFALNIRNYLGDNATNAGIQDTAINEPENFFFFNNGVSAVATGIAADVEKGLLRCDQFAVINGAQTVRSLIKAHTRKPLAAGTARVLVRVSEVEISRDEDENAFLDNITRFNNTQNPVKLSDFRSNDGVQRALNKRFSQLSRAGGKQYWYKNKRTGERERNRIPILMEEFAQTIFSFRFGPVDAKGGKSHLFDPGDKGGYAQIFGTDGVVWESIRTEDFERLAGEWFLCSEARDILKELKKDSIEKAQEEQRPIVREALERRWLIYFTIGELLREKYSISKRDLILDLQGLAKPKWLDENASSGTRLAVKKYCNAAKEVLVRTYRSARKDPSFVQRNWYRSDQTLEEIRSDISNAESLIESLPPLRSK